MVNKGSNQSKRQPKQLLKAKQQQPQQQSTVNKGKL